MRIKLISKSTIWSLLASISIFSLSGISTATAETNYNFLQIAMSGDGQTIYAANNDGSIWKSSDTGTTWSALPSAGTRQWATIATSQNGSVVVAADNGSGSLYVSQDSGTTWTERTGANASSWQSVVISSDGSKIKAITTNRLDLFESADYGATWSINATLPRLLNTIEGCSDPCAIPSWAEITMSGSANKIALLVTAPGSFISGRQLLISQDSGATWVQTTGCCRDQSEGSQIASSRNDENWTIIMGNYESNPGYLRYDETNSLWTVTNLVVNELSGDGTNVNSTTWRGFAIAADGDQTIFTGQFGGDNEAGRNESLFTGSISTELIGVFHDEFPGSRYQDVAISDSGVVRAALRGSTGEFILSTDSGATFTKSRIFMLPLEPSFGSQTEYSDSYTVQIDNYDSAFQWAVSVTSGTASIDSSGLITVSNPVGASMITVTTNRNRYPEGSASNAYASLTGNRANAVWQSMPGNASSNVFNGGSIFDVAINPVNGDIYVGGSFTNVNGDPAADYIMRFDGTQWLSVPGGFSNGSGEGSNGIFALAFDATGKLYAGGKFANAGGDANADNLAQWDGTSWSAVGQTSFNGSLRAIEILGDGRVLVGGQFTAAAGITGANYIAAWNGSAWSKIGTTVLTGYVRSMTHSRNGGIYIGGFFTNVGGDSDADNVVQLINGDWARVGVPPTGENVAVSIAVDDSTSTDKLYIGGYFYSDEMSRRLLKWDGQTWTAPDIGLNGDVRALTYSRNYGLFLGGWFTKSANNRFGSGLGLLVNDVLYGIGDSNNNGTGMEGALRNDVYSLALTSDNQIIAAGEFTSVAGVAYTNRIARTASWTPPVNLLPTETSTPNASDTSTAIANAQALREAEIRKQAKIDSAFAGIVKNMKAGETLTLALAQEAELACFSSANIDYANTALFSASVESRTAKTFIDGISKRLCILNDLTSARPQTNSVRQMVAYGVLAPTAYKPSLTLQALRKLPLASRSTYADIQVAIAKIQSEFLAKKKLLEARIRG